MITRNSFLNLKRELRQSNTCLNTLFYLPFPCSSSWIILHGWYFPRHTSKLAWPNSPGHCLTSSICPGTHPLQPKVRHIHLSQQDVDRPAPVKDVEEPLRKGLISFCVLASELGLTKQGFLIGDLMPHKKSHPSGKVSGVGW